MKKTEFVYQPKYGIVVLCADESEQKSLYDKLFALGLKLKVVAV
ncbi:hypothetical protein [uncultured Alistipes sp.]|nr:hypothetical protein [uncultured Alistipes sp.]